MCYTVMKKKEAFGGSSADQYILNNTKFVDMYELMLDDRMTKLKRDFIENKDVFDSIQVWYKRVNITDPELLIQDSTHQKNLDCFLKAIYFDPNAKVCTKY